MKETYLDFKCKFDNIGGLSLKNGGLVGENRRKHATDWFVCHEMTEAMGLYKAKHDSDATISIRLSTNDFPGALMAKLLYGQAYVDQNEINCLEVKAFKPGANTKSKPVFIGTNKSDALLVNMTRAIKKILGPRTIKDKDTIVGYIGITPKENTK
jgi:hypothetical protein